jgi:hypothetical protein
MMVMMVMTYGWRGVAWRGVAVVAGDGVPARVPVEPGRALGRGESVASEQARHHSQNGMTEALVYSCVWITL